MQTGRKARKFFITCDERLRLGTKIITLGFDPSVDWAGE